MPLRRGSPAVLTSRVVFFLELERTPRRLDPSGRPSHAPAVPVGAETCLSGLRSGTEAERSQALSELRSFLRRALGKSFGTKLADGDLDDLTQESLLRIHARLDTFREQSRFTTWATAIAVNCALSELRKRRYRHVSLEDAAERGDSALSQEVNDSLGREQELLRLRQGIDTALTARQREATLATLGGLPLMEVARRLETSQGAVYKLLHDARSRLKVYLEREPFPEATPAVAP
jgi:RNA polymerase sigma-70 factor, ECF subfamily